MTDPLTKEQRSAHMAKIRGKGNKSTELAVEQALIDNGVIGWEKQNQEILGKPDFYFPQHKLVLFVDGCFWHGCPKCGRNTPRTRSEFWKDKIDSNRRRDSRYHRKLRSQGYHVMRVWEHELGHATWIKRLNSLIARIQQSDVAGSSV